MLLVLDPAYLQFFGDDFLRLLLLRYVFCDVVLHLHRSFKVSSSSKCFHVEQTLLCIFWYICATFDLSCLCPGLFTTTALPASFAWGRLVRSSFSNASCLWSCSASWCAQPFYGHKSRDWLMFNSQTSLLK